MRKKITFATSILVAVMLLFSFNSFGQGLETFANFPETGSSYEDGTFTGQDGSEWSYVQCSGNAEIDNETPLLASDETAEVQSGTISGGIDTLNFDYMQAFSSDVELEVYVNGNLVTTVTSSGEQGTVKNSGDIEVKMGGDFTISFVQSSSGGQVSVDNVDWTAHAGPSITNVAASPEYPTSDETVTVSADVSDEGTVDSIFTTYGTTSGSLEDTIDMTSTSGDTYEGNIPTHADGTEVFYEITAVDDQNDTTTTSEMSYMVADTYTTLPFEEDFESASDFASIGWSTQVTTGDMDWYITSDGGDQFAEMTNFDTDVYENFESETWLITPGIDLSSESEAYFGFVNAYDFSGDSITVWASTDYNGDVTTANWDSLAPELSSTQGFNDVFSGYLDFSAYAGDTVHVAFKYTGTDSDGSTWQVDDVSAVSAVAPAIENISISPENPTSDSTVTISADVTSEASTIDTAYVAWGTTSGDLTQDTIGMVSSGDTYETKSDIPAQSDSTEVFYTITAADNQEDTTVTDEMSYMVLDPVYETMPYEEDFESASSLKEIGWTTQVLTGEMDWAIASHEGDTYAEMSNFDTDVYENFESETWLITPGFDLSSATDVYFSFENAFSNEGDSIEVYASTNYDGLSDPSTADWDTLAPELSTGGYTDVYSGAINFTDYGYTGDSVHVAFKYTGTDTTGATWQIDDVSLLSYIAPRIENISTSPENPTSSDPVTVSADAFDEDGTVDTVFVAYGTASGTLEDTVGMSGTSDTYTGDIPAQADDTEVFYEITAKDDEGYTTTTQEMSYSVNDPTAVTLPFHENFEKEEDGLGQMTAYNITGDQEWYWSDHEDLTFAKMSGYDGNNNNENKDWLITPPIDLSDESAASLQFKEAVIAASEIDEELEIYVSTDFTESGDPTSATWNKHDVTNRSPEPGNYEYQWATVNPIDLSEYIGENEVVIGFKYTSTDDNSASWEVDSISVTSEAPANIAPEITDVSVNPSEPDADESVQINATITDDNPGDTIIAEIKYGTASDDLTESVEMTNEGTGSDDTYAGEIPGQDGGTRVYFEIAASDEEDTTTTSGDYQVADDANAIIDGESLTLEVYPNPGNGQYSIEIDSETGNSYNVTVFNTVGEMVYNKEFNGQSVRKTINITDQNDGIYFLKVRGKNVDKVVKLIKE